EGVRGGPDGGIDLLDRGKVDLLRERAGGRVVDRPTPSGLALERTSADPVMDAGRPAGPLSRGGTGAGRTRLCDLRHVDLSVVVRPRLGQPPRGVAVRSVAGPLRAA